ncbi:hypothetical protein B0H19DRAFT_1275154 [Mycena capillaripes]|nr:hypothetical protein B0H19DRAFT_1275154 [Mycena capillaripes]
MSIKHRLTRGKIVHPQVDWDVLEAKHEQCTTHGDEMVFFAEDLGWATSIGCIVERPQKDDRLRGPPCPNAKSDKDKTMSWDAWGPPLARWLDDTWAGCHPMSSGQRVVSMLPHAVEDRIRILDFNPATLQLLAEENARHSGVPLRDITPVRRASVLGDWITFLRNP